MDRLFAERISHGRPQDYLIRVNRQTADDRLTLLAHVILGPAGALVVSPIQFVFDSPQRNAATKSSLSVMSKIRSSLVVAKINRNCELMPQRLSFSPLGSIFLWSRTNCASIVLDSCVTPEKSKRRRWQSGWSTKTGEAT